MKNILVKAETIKKAMVSKRKEQRKKYIEQMKREYVEICTSFCLKDKKWYSSCPHYMFIKSSDDRITQNTKLIAMYLCSVKRIKINENKINELFDTKYKNMNYAIKNTLSLNLLKDLGYDVIPKDILGDIIWYNIKFNKNLVRENIKKYEETLVV